MRGLSAARTLVAVAGLTALLALAAHDAPAQNAAAAAHDLETSEDFRVRVAAALNLGRTHAAGARAMLEHALGDPHPAVRIAVAAALGVLGDPAAIPAMQQRIPVETSPGVKSQLQVSITSLSAISDSNKWTGTHYVVTIGDMRNRSGVRGDGAAAVLRTATNAHAQAIPGALLVDQTDAGTLQQAATRHIPVLLIDGALQRLSQAQQDAQVSYHAQVDFSMRRVPEQMLRGTLSGAATSIGSLSALGDPSIVQMLQDQAIDGAVESALRGAPQGFGEAVK
jgi:HEAT repeats